MILSETVGCDITAPSLQYSGSIYFSFPSHIRSSRLRINAGLFKLITGGHRYAQDINPFGLLDVANEAVLVFQFIVAQRRHLSSSGFDTGPDEMGSVMTQGVTHGRF